MEMTRLDDLHPDIIARVLRHFDGPTLAVAGCSTSLLRSLSSDPDLWRRLCLCSCPSLRHRLLASLLSGYHRSFFFDSFPSPFLPDDDDDDDDMEVSPGLPTRFFSAVDLHCGGNPVFSRVIDADASSDSGFLTSPFRLNAVVTDEPVAARPEHLSLSWVVIHPETRRSVRLTSRQPAAVTRCQRTGETLVRFAVVLRGWAVSAVVTCGDYDVVKDVRLTVEDADGVTVSGREGLGLLATAMEGRRRGAKWEAGARGRYEEYLKRKGERSDKAVRREVRMELCAGLVSLMVMIFIIRLCFK